MFACVCVLVMISEHCYGMSVCVLIGREARINQLKLDKAGVMVDMATNKIPVNDDESTSVPHIYALGDVAMVRQCCHGDTVLPW